MVKTALLQLVWAGPATDTVGTTLVSVTVEELVQVPLVIVHRNVAGLVVTVTVVFLVVSEAIVAAPLTTDQVAVSPAAGAFAAIVKEELLHFDCAGPALLIVDTLLVRTTVEALVQLPLAIVQVSVAGLVATVTVEVRLVGAEMVAAPPVTVQVPVSPVAGVFAAMVKTLLLQLV
jgi:hypothetical protein